MTYESYDIWVIWYLQKSPAMKTSHGWMTHDPYAHIMHNTSHIQTHTNRSYLICKWLLDQKSPATKISHVWCLIVCVCIWDVSCMMCAYGSWVCSAMKISHEWCLIYKWLLVKDVYLCVSYLFVCITSICVCERSHMNDVSYMNDYPWHLFIAGIAGLLASNTRLFHKAFLGFWKKVKKFRSLLQDSFDRICVGRWLRWVGSLKF